MEDNTRAGYEAQYKYCEDNQLPIFIYGGCTCFMCGRNIFSQPGGITVESAGKRHITGCPFCNHSFCE